MIASARRRSLIAVALAATFALTLLPTDAHAQRRGGAVARGRGAVVVAPLYFGSALYDPFMWGGGWGGGWGGWGGWGPMWGGGWYPPFGGYGGRVVGSARLRVTPKQTEVYVDGYLAGAVDDFDGVFQRLDVEPGEHELKLYLDGHQSIVERRYFPPGTTVEIRHQMVPLAPGDTPPARPTASAAAGRTASTPAEPGGPDAPPRPAPRRRGPWGGPPPVPADSVAVEGYGTLAIRIQPADATLVVDGEEWAAPDGEGPIRIDLAEGPHYIEVRKEGATSYLRTVDVRAGRTLSLNVSLSR